MTKILDLINYCNIEQGTNNRATKVIPVTWLYSTLHTFISVYILMKLSSSELYHDKFYPDQCARKSRDQKINVSCGILIGLWLALTSALTVSRCGESSGTVAEYRSLLLQSDFTFLWWNFSIANYDANRGPSGKAHPAGTTCPVLYRKQSHLAACRVFLYTSAADHEYTHSFYLSDLFLLRVYPSA